MIAFRAFLEAFLPEIVVEHAKIHLASWDGWAHPLDVFYNGEFDEWQSNQTQKNFGRRHVIALIPTPIPHRWMFAGAWVRQGEPVWQVETWAARKGHRAIELWIYPLERLATAEQFAGRLYLSYRRTGRNSYRNAETILDEIEVSSLQETPRGIARFGGYNEVLLAMPALRRIVAEPPEDWLTALSLLRRVDDDVTRLHLVGEPDEETCPRGDGTRLGIRQGAAQSGLHGFALSAELGQVANLGPADRDEALVDGRGTVEFAHVDAPDCPLAHCATFRRARLGIGPAARSVRRRARRCEAWLASSVSLSTRAGSAAMALGRRGSWTGGNGGERRRRG